MSNHDTVISNFMHRPRCLQDLKRRPKVLHPSSVTIVADINYFRKIESSTFRLFVIKALCDETIHRGSYSQMSCRKIRILATFH